MCSAVSTFLMLLLSLSEELDEDVLEIYSRSAIFVIYYG